MSASPSDDRSVTSHRKTAVKQCANKAAYLEALAKLVEEVIPTLKSKDERRFYRQVVRGYRKATQRGVRVRDS